MRKGLIGLVVLAALLIAGRLALPSFLRDQINKHLNQVSGYAGGVNSVHIALWRGAYALRGVRIEKKNGSKTYPFFSASNIDVSLAWRDLIHRQIVSDIIIDDGRVNFIKTRSAETSQLKVDKTWQDVVKAIFPVDVTLLQINNGRIHFRDETANPPVNVYVEHLQFFATGLRNRKKPNGPEYPAHVELSGESIGNGRLSVWAEADPLSEHAHFLVRGQIVNVALPALNPFLKAYGGLEMAGGSFNLYGEMVARGGRYEGYVKPFFIHVKFTDITEPGRSVPERAWQALVSGLQFLLKNKHRDELSTRIPFSGQFDHTDIGVLATIGSMLQNGFIKALPEALEYDVKTSLPKPSPPPPKAPPTAAASSGTERR